MLIKKIAAIMVAITVIVGLAACGKAVKNSSVNTLETTTTAATSTETTTTEVTTEAAEEAEEKVILCYNPQSLTVGEGVATFTRSTAWQSEPFYLYLLGVENPDKIEVKDWVCISKEQKDNGLIKLTLLNESTSFRAILEGSVLYEGRVIVNLYDGTPY